jgi:hypothetical protein
MPVFTSRIQAAAGGTSKITNSGRHHLESLLIPLGSEREILTFSLVTAVEALAKAKKTS